MKLPSKPRPRQEALSALRSQGLLRPGHCLDCAQGRCESCRGAPRAGRLLARGEGGGGGGQLRAFREFRALLGLGVFGASLGLMFILSEVLESKFCCLHTLSMLCHDAATL